MATKRPKLPKDPSQRAKAILDLATGTAVPEPTVHFSASQQFAREGGLKGGRARAVALDKESRSSIARKAAFARWGKDDSGDSNT